ncbi:flagellar export chaperone FlgN [Desulfonatronospira sp.]|uniref:flagellar export chaperone FlgN n=1 Tax=Desulfonatronospira sp. TaxID=1962951 RepID=UPI0025B96866|nr:flagellar export chaperone FlgN [Desulfonatronospira sp.]
MDIMAALKRQKLALKLLLLLLQEEYSALMNNRPEKVSSLEFSLQELVRQMIREKEDLINTVQGAGFDGLGDYISGMDEVVRQQYLQMLQELEQEEKNMALQAVKNASIAQALSHQSAMLAREFIEQATPRQPSNYSADGRRYNDFSREAGFFRGRM